MPSPVITEDDPATVGSTEGAQRKFGASLISAAAPSTDLASSQISAAVARGNGAKSGAGRRILPEGRTYDSLRESVLQTRPHPLKKIQVISADLVLSPVPSNCWRMAIYHFSLKNVCRKSNRSAVAASAYRAGARLKDERTGKIHNYGKKQGVVHTEIILPEGVKADWALDREKLWNAVEKAESRKDARTAREIVLALPHELTADERLELTRDFAQEIANQYGVAVDFAIHTPPSTATQSQDADEDAEPHPVNHHAHLLITTRKVEPDGFNTQKSIFEKSDAWLRKNDLPTAPEQLKILRKTWEIFANHSLARAGHDVRITCDSHKDSGINIKPTKHVGPEATAIQRKEKKASQEQSAEKDWTYNESSAGEQLSTGKKRQQKDGPQEQSAEKDKVHSESPIGEQPSTGNGKNRQRKKASRERMTEEDNFYNMNSITNNPYEILKKITSEQSVFTHRDISRHVRRAVGNKNFKKVYDRVMSCTELVDLCPDPFNANQKKSTKYSTREMIQIEASIADNADELVQIRHKVPIWKLYSANVRANKTLKTIVGSKLSREQRDAIKHVTRSTKISAVVGRAGAGKSTLLAAARDAWESAGCNVIGSAIAGKAVDGLQKSSGIRSRTLASLQLSWQNGHSLLEKNDVLVVDESGMLDSRQLAAIIAEVKKREAKLVLVGDPDQLQPIGPGAAFRAVVDRIGCANLTEIRRQSKQWQKEASEHLAEGQTEFALKSYEAHDRIQICDDHITAIRNLAKDYLSECKSEPDQSILALAHKRRDVQMINLAIRTARKISGELKGGVLIRTNNGLKAFATGDRIMLLENDRKLNVKNGMLGTVRDVNHDHMKILLDDSKREVTIKMEDYRAIDHGYAATIHKSQGATVDQSFVFASKTMDHHLSYVALTRHRTDARIYADSRDFGDLNEMSKAFARDRSKETTLDYIDGFNRRRSIDDPEIEDELSPFPNRKWTKRSKREAALDFFAHAWEEVLWMEYHGMNPRQIPQGKLKKAYERLESAKPGLASEVEACMDDRWLQVQVTETSGEARVRAIELAIDLEFKKTKSAERDHHAGYQNDFSDQRAGRKAKPDPDKQNYSYTPNF